MDLLIVLEFVKPPFPAGSKKPAWELISNIRRWSLGFNSLGKYILTKKNKRERI